MKLVAAGHSHLSALMKAARLPEASPSVETFFMRLGHASNRPNFTIDPGSGQRRITEALSRKIRFVLRREAPEAVILAAMGNEHSALALLHHSEPFDFLSPFGPEGLLGGATPVPFGAIRAQLATLAARNALLFVDAFADAFDGPIYIVPPAPPNPDAEHILSYPGSFAERAREYGISDATLRLKVWRVYCDLLREAAALRPNVTLFDLPQGVFGPDGCLAPDCWHSDPTHGNAAYGQAVWRALIETLRTQSNTRMPGLRMLNMEVLT